MNKEELVSTIANDTNLTKKDINTVLDSTLKSIQSALVNSEKVTLVGFGTFEPKDRAAREGRNPKNGDVIHIPAKKVAVFRVGKSLAEAVMSSGNKVTQIKKAVAKKKTPAKK
jgi:DNA-binding protein HU-beta